MSVVIVGGNEDWYVSMKEFAKITDAGQRFL